MIFINEVLSSWDDTELERQILAKGDDRNTTESSDRYESSSLLRQRSKNKYTLAEDAVILLAQGILRQYDRVLTGQEIVRQDDRLAPELHSAMCKLGRLYVEEGKCDRAACVHDVLERSRYSLDRYEKWNLNIFCESEFRFGNVELIDFNLRVPTADCAEIADLSGGFGEDNVIENRLHSRLREDTARLGGRRQHQAYTALRELLGRRSLIKQGELFDYLVEHNLTPLQKTVIEFFDPVSEVWLINDYAHRCAHCGTLETVCKL